MHSVRRRSAALAAVAVVAAVLTGCVGQDPAPTPTPTPKATPLYSSDEEALAAAKAAYAKYVEVSNEVAHNGWADLSPLKTVATGDALKADEQTGAKYKSQSITMTGDLAATVDRVQRVSSESVDAYVCLDVSATRFIDSSGVDQTSPTRSGVIPLEVRFVPNADALMVGRTDQWSGPSFCS